MSDVVTAEPVGRGEVRTPTFRFPPSRWLLGFAPLTPSLRELQRVGSMPMLGDGLPPHYGGMA
jgi:hypothetical protein